MAEQAGLGADTIVAKNQRYVIFPWTRQSAVKLLHIKTARGRYLYDADGRRYLDLSAQLVNVNIGHQHPRVMEAIKHQADELCYATPAYLGG